MAGYRGSARLDRFFTNQSRDMRGGTGVREKGMRGGAAGKKGGPAGGRPLPGRGKADLAFDAGLERRLSGFQREADVAQAQADEQRAALFAETFDPNDPFAKQALLDRNLKQAAASQALAVGQRHGGIYSGAFEELQARGAFDEGLAREQLYRNYASAAGDVDRTLADRLAALSAQSEDAVWESAQTMANTFDAQPRFGRRRPRRKR